MRWNKTFRSRYKIKPVLRILWKRWGSLKYSLLKIYGACTASHCQKHTSLYAFGSEFRQSRNIASDITSGIRANVEAALPLQLASFAEWQNVATDNPQRIRTAKDGGGSNRNEICAMQISQVRNVHGSTFLTVPPVGICSAPCICIISFQKGLQ